MGRTTERLQSYDRLESLFWNIMPSRYEKVITATLIISSEWINGTTAI